MCVYRLEPMPHCESGGWKEYRVALQAVQAGAGVRWRCNQVVGRGADEQERTNRWERVCMSGSCQIGVSAKSEFFEAKKLSDKID